MSQKSIYKIFDFQWQLLSGLIFFLFLIGCTPKIASVETPVEETNQFSASGETAIPDQWWTAFNDEQLNSLIESALDHNMDLINVWYQLEAAKAVRKQQASFLLPDIDAGAQTAISRPQPDFAGGENTQFGVGAEYEVDLWGRIRANVDAEDFRIEATYYDYQTAAISLSAEIATIWFQLITLQKQIDLANLQIENNEKIIELIKARFGSGQTRGVDILRQQQLLEGIRNLKISYETDLALLKNQLGILTGEAPQNFDISVRNYLPELPAQPTTGLPLELIRRRPDVQREYSFLLATGRDMAVAVTNKFPRLSLDLSTQARSNTYSELFNNWAYTIGGNILAPLIYGGRLRAEVDRTEAVKNQQIQEYGQTILLSFREVEDALIQEENQWKRIEILEERNKMAEKINQQLRVEFVNGFTNYLDVLLSLDDQQQLQRDIIDAEQFLYENRIELYRALAGGFETEREQTNDVE